LIPPEEIPGTTMRVDIAKDGQYKPKKYSSGGKMPTETIETLKADFDFSTAWGINFTIANDLIEDSQFDLIEMHIANAGREMGEYASNEACTILYAPPDGDGTLNINAATGNTAETKWTGGTTNDVETCMIANLADGYVPDTMVCSHGAMLHSIYTTVPTYNSPWTAQVLGHPTQGGGGWPTTMMGLNIVYTECTIIAGTAAVLKTIVFTKDYAMITGRKRWLRIEKYSDPIRDLVGATITARQDSVTLYKDSIAYMYET